MKIRFDFPGRVVKLLLAAVAAVPIAGGELLLAEADGPAARPTLRVPACEHFAVNGRGDAEPWKLVEWQQLKRRPGGSRDYRTRFKMLYSDKGVYVLFDAADEKLTASMREDFLDLWNEDVFECFFWTDERDPIYFEYEISPLGYELPILIPNLGGEFLGWRPWHYEGDRKTEKAVVALGGKQESNAEVSGWRAEVFFPFALFRPLRNVPPRPGDRWRANFYRMDYDGGSRTGWDWARVGPSFHEYQKFGTVVFE